MTLFNRTRERGERVAAEIGVPFRPLTELDETEAEILVLALASDGGGEFSIDLGRVQPGSVVIDLVYGGSHDERRGRGAPPTVVYVEGREVLLFQAIRQFELMTGQELPVDLGVEVLGLEPLNGPERSRA